MDPGRIHDWLVQSALPLWAGAGLDESGGGFVEELTLDGQARQIYTYSHAHLLGWDGPWLDAARHGYDFMTAHFWHRDGGWIFTTERDGTPADTVREAYEQAFALFASAWFYRASGDARALEWAARTLDFMDGQLADPGNGGYLESVPDKLPRRQNPHMHLLEAMLSLHWATGDPQYLDRARRLHALFQHYFFDAPTGTLGEFFTAAWAPAAGQPGTLVEPGHHFEWVWLLQQYGRAAGDDVSTEQAALYAFAERHGVDPADDLVFDGVLRSGAPHDDNKRLWVQTEAIKAQIVRIEQGDNTARGRLDRLLSGLFDNYLRADGLWQDHLRRDGTGFAARAPASSFYHVFLALSEVLRLAAGRSSSPFPAA